MWRELQRLGVRRGRDLEGGAFRAPAPAPLPAVLEGRRVERGAGSCFVVEEEYAGGYRHGGSSLDAVLGESVERLSALAAPGPAQRLSPAGLAFLDIETTGLPEGAGMYAFLVGLGRFEGPTFHLYQVFLRSPAEEQAFLLTIADLLREAEGLVTYNGRGFDLPVLQNRYTVGRLPCPWRGKAHLDLLLPVRRLWRDRLTRCSLASVEQHCLGVERSFLDLPGWKIPSVYHDYLRGARPEVLKPVFYHNAQDVLSLVTLTARLARFLRDPFGEGGARHGLEFYALGRWYDQQGEKEQAIAAYRAALLLALPVEVREQAWERLAALLKRQKAWAEAVAIWEALVERRGDHPLYAYVELAKYYEHRCQDLERAEALVRRAVAEHGVRPAGEDLERRLERLRRKRRGQIADLCITPTRRYFGQANVECANGQLGTHDKETR